MRIGILTLPLHTNYGGILQAYALQTVLERMGHEVHVIEKERQPLSLPIQKMPFCYGKRIVKNIIGWKCPIFYEQKYNREQPIIRQNTDKFIKKYIHIAEYDDFSDIKESEYDAIVVGSDQVWRPKYFGKNQIENAYLKFAEGWNIKRIAYAASFGTDEWEYNSKQTSECGRLLRMFDAVSVREDSGVDLCKRYFGVEAQHVLDPTMLLDREDYIKLFEAADTPKSKGTLLNYILDGTPEKKVIIENITREKGLIPFCVNSKVENCKAKLNERIQPPLEQWLRGFYDAELVITDSFHACVFSILFQKPFIMMGNINRGLSRFSSLICMLGLEDKLIMDNHMYKVFTDIDWNKVLSVLITKKNSAITFLSNKLNATNEK